MWPDDRIRKRFRIAFAVLWVCLIGGHQTTWAQDEPDVDQGEGPPALNDDPAEDQAESPPAPRPATTSPVWSPETGAPIMPSAYPWLDHEGSFRFRPGYFRNLHLGTYVAGVSSGFSSSQPPPLSHSDINQEVVDDQENGVNSFDMRLRYSPKLHLMDNLSIRGTFDVLDNTVFGSHPEAAFYRNDAPLTVMSRGAAPPESSVNSFRDGLRVKALYADWLTALGILRVGRQPHAWGMGMVNNPGDCLDCDFGDFRDQIFFLTRPSSAYLSLSIDWITSGVHTETRSEPFGRPRTLSNIDDALEYTASFFWGSVTTADFVHRNRRLSEERRPVLEGGGRLSYRAQEFSSETPLNKERLPDAQVEVPFFGPRQWDGFQVAPRDFWTLVPNLWGRLEWLPAPGRRILLEAEVAAVFGSIGSYFPQETEESIQVDIRSLGGVLRGHYEHNKVNSGLELGVATGGGLSGFGVNDVPGLPLDSSADATMNSFFFNRDYRVDLLLFRQVIGTVTNAMYIKPGVGYDFIQTDMDRLGIRGDAIFSMAWDPDLTPGGNRLLGLELNAGLTWRHQDTVTLAGTYGILIPFAGLNLPTGSQAAPDGREATVAQTIQGWMVFSF